MTGKTKHTPPEPDGWDLLQIMTDACDDSHYKPSYPSSSPDEVSAARKRIEACVDACAGIPDKELEKVKGNCGASPNSLRLEIKQMKVHRDELIEEVHRQRRAARELEAERDEFKARVKRLEDQNDRVVSGNSLLIKQAEWYEKRGSKLEGLVDFLLNTDPTLREIPGTLLILGAIANLDANRPPGVDPIRIRGGESHE